MTTTLVGLFDDPTAAQSAVRDLVAAGFDRQNARLVDASTSGMLDLVSLGVPRNDADLYAQRVKAGGTLVTVTAETSRVETAQGIMDRDGAVDLDGAATLGTTTTTSTTAATAAPLGDKLEVVEETLQVGKREVERGGMRVRSFVTETPVSEQVTLREERVDVVRTPVDRPATEADFQTGTIEMKETAEVAVVAKEARVVEEISLNKTATERTETVSDTVRRTDVEIVPVGSTTKVASDHGTSFRDHLASADPSARYERHEPAYAYGSQLASDPTHGGADFEAGEASHKERWEEKNPGTWEEFKGSVKHAFDSLKSKSSGN